MSINTHWQKMIYSSYLKSSGESYSLCEKSNHISSVCALIGWYYVIIVLHNLHIVSYCTIKYNTYRWQAHFLCCLDLSIYVSQLVLVSTLIFFHLFTRNHILIFHTVVYLPHLCRIFLYRLSAATENHFSHCQQ